MRRGGERGVRLDGGGGVGNQLMWVVWFSEREKWWVRTGTRKCGYTCIHICAHMHYTVGGEHATSTVTAPAPAARTTTCLLLERQHAGLVLGARLVEPGEAPQQQVQEDEDGRLQVVAVWVGVELRVGWGCESISDRSGRTSGQT